MKAQANESTKLFTTDKDMKQVLKTVAEKVKASADKADQIHRARLAEIQVRHTT